MYLHAFSSFINYNFTMYIYMTKINMEHRKYTKCIAMFTGMNMSIYMLLSSLDL